MTKVKAEDTDIMPYYKTVVLSIWINFHVTIIHMGNCKESRNMTIIRFIKYTEIKQNRFSINFFVILDKGMCQSSNYLYFHIQLITLRYLYLDMLSYEKIFPSGLVLSDSFLQLWHIVNCLEESSYNV